MKNMMKIILAALLLVVFAAGANALQANVQINTEADVLMPDAAVARGFAERSAANIKVGEIVQFVRFGFCRLERKENGTPFKNCLSLTTSLVLRG